MEVFIVFSFLAIASFYIGYITGHKHGFEECEEIKQKYSLTTSKGISGREYVEKYGECPICEDCPHNCPLETEFQQVTSKLKMP